MTGLSCRTNETTLSDSELIILDVMFRDVVEIRLLRNSVFQEQWNLPYSHDLCEDSLGEALASLCHRGILDSHTLNGKTVLQMTALGGQDWSSERCPVWERFCMERYKTTCRGRTIMTVVAVSPTIRDDFLHDWPMYPADRKTTTISDFGLIPWLSFGRLYVGAAIYDEPSEWAEDEYMVYSDLRADHQKTLASNRSWWRMVSELQKFVIEGIS